MTEFVFINPKKGTVICESSISGAFREFKKKALPSRTKLHFHSLRHSYGTAQADAGVPAIEIMDNMGHSSVRVTERYIHPEKLAKKATTNFLANRKEIM